MHFLIQSNIRNPEDHQRTVEALNELGFSYEVFELAPGMEQIKTHSGRTDVFPYGSVKLAKLAKQNTDWFPGSFYGGNHLYEVYSDRYKGYLLNETAQVFRVGENISWKEKEQKFIKPYREAKLFTGQVFSESEWTDFVYESLRGSEASYVQVSVPAFIYKEARIWVVGGKIAAGVYYKFHKQTPFESFVAPEGMAFAAEMIAVFNVAEAFVLDICLTENGWKIVEVNCINSAGFYPNLDIKRVLRSLHDHFSKNTSS